MLSPDEVAAVDDEHMTIHVVRGTTGQKDCGAHQVRGVTPPAGGDVVEDPLIGFGVRSCDLGDRRRVVPRRDRVHLDVVLGELVAVRLGETGQTVLGGGISRRPLTTEEGEQGSDIYDLARPFATISLDAS